MTCRRCGCRVDRVQGELVAFEPETTADGLSYCPPNPDARTVGKHAVRKES